MNGKASILSLFFFEFGKTWNKLFFQCKKKYKKNLFVCLFALKKWHIIELRGDFAIA
jgi:hypothetical protein